MTERVIKIWEWRDAPEEFRALSDHGGDEDYVALVPPQFWTPIWLLECGAGHFGICCISQHYLEDGSRVYIGAHA